MKNFTYLIICTFLLTIGFNSFAQVDKFNQIHLKTAIRGDEISDINTSEVIEVKWTPKFAPVLAGDILFNIYNITDIATGYDLQSNASTQQVWVDYNNPDYVHAHFVNSQQSAGWSDRKCLYFGSVDKGLTWFELGPVPSSGRSGFPALYGNSDGAGVLSNHNNFFGGFVRTTLSIDAGPFDYNFTNYDPGDLGDGPVWPRLVVDQNDNVVFASSGAPDGILHINTLDVSTGQFTGWQNVLDGGEAEMYDFSISDNGKIAFAFGGNDSNNGDVFLMESTDGGLNWTAPLKIWDANNPGTTPVLGLLRGVQVNYYAEEPCVAFELGQITSTGYFPGLPSEIRFWRANVNGGVPVIVADSSMIPFHPNYGTTDVHLPLCRPVIGRATNGYLFIAFTGTTGDYWPGTGPTDSTAYYAGFFSYSADGGETWTEPAKFTPDAPLRDWRYPSIAEVVPVIITDGEFFTVHIVMQGDSIPGSTVNAGGSMPRGVTAQYYHFSADVVIGSADNEFFIVDYSLSQNYPNPFNPSTKISWQSPVSSWQTLKVYDVLGNEVATLINEYKPAGSYEVEFNANNLSSGTYFYKLSAGSLVQVKKMILLK